MRLTGLEQLGYRTVILRRDRDGALAEYLTGGQFLYTKSRVVGSWRTHRCANWTEV